MLVDSHCHLDLLGSLDEINELLIKAKAENIIAVQTISTKIKDFHKIIDIANKFRNVFASIGVHPNEVEDIIAAQDLLNVINSSEKVTAIGETGLDYYYETKDKKKQILSFEQHIIASQSIKREKNKQMPVIVHSREAESDSVAILSDYMNSYAFPALIHCFTASKDFATKILDLGLYISISGIVTFKNAAFLEEIVRFTPLDRLLIETDSPYLAPVPMRGKKNQPAFVKYVAEKIAVIKEKDFEEICHITTENFFTLFANAKIVNNI